MITYFAMNLVSRFPRSTTHNTMMYVTKKLLGKGNELSIHKLRHTHATLLQQCNVP
ncbi:Integrase XerD family protein, partial [human gut metagenome]